MCYCRSACVWCVAVHAWCIVCVSVRVRVHLCVCACLSLASTNIYAGVVVVMQL